MNVSLHLTYENDVRMFEGLVKEMYSSVKICKRFTHTGEYLILGSQRINWKTKFILKVLRPSFFIYQEGPINKDKHMTSVINMSDGLLAPPFSKKEVQKMMRWMIFQNLKRKNKRNVKGKNSITFPIGD